MATNSKHGVEKKNRALQVGMTKDLMNKGYTVSQIAEKLKISESIVWEYVHIIDAAERKKSQA